MKSSAFVRWLAGFVIFALPLLCVVLLTALIFRAWQGGSEPEANAKPRPVTARGSLSEEEKSNIAIYAQASPSLVQVTNLTVRRSVFDLDAHEVPKGVGSGFVWDEAGYIVTNFHVVENADAVRVTLADHSVYDAGQIWAYPDKDIAVIRIGAPARSSIPSWSAARTI